MESTDRKPSKLKKFFKETKRVMRITKKPNKEEYINHIKVTGIGIAIIGAIGFVIFIIRQLLIN